MDVDVVGDVRVFISPRALRLLPSAWGGECVSLVQGFFERVLDLIRTGRNAETERLLRILREPNETHLGLSKAKAQGRALGTESAHDVSEALSKSEAVKTGLLQDLEDTILMVDGISVDIVSDITTNIIREPLIQYTQETCGYYGIPLQQMDSGPLWDARAFRWHSRFEHLPAGPRGKLLLVPKAIVRTHSEYSVNEYYHHYLLEHLQEAELNANSELVELLKSGHRRVTKKALMKKYGRGKSVIVRETLKHPEVLERYRRDKNNNLVPPLSHEEIAEVEVSPVPDWDSLLSNVTNVRAGQADAPRYEKEVEALLSALFYPALVNPRVQHEIHGGRKRIDITYTNMATEGFFQWLAAHFPASHVFVECKNYGRDVGNPELDQLAGRFSPSRGQFGLLVCRSFEDKQLFMQRCRDTASDGRGFIIPLDDDDLRVLVDTRKQHAGFFSLALIKGRVDQLIM